MRVAAANAIGTLLPRPQGLVKHFFNEKEVTSTLVMDALYSGCRQIEQHTREADGSDARVRPCYCCSPVHQSCAASTLAAAWPQQQQPCLPVKRHDAMYCNPVHRCLC